jgi:hypothetical protein
MHEAGAATERAGLRGGGHGGVGASGVVDDDIGSSFG